MKEWVIYFKKNKNIMMNKKNGIKMMIILKKIRNDF